jgi:hypothetical protein
VEQREKLFSVAVSLGVPVAIGAGAFVLAVRNGGWDLTTWATGAVLVWWAIAFVAALDLAPNLTEARAALVPAAALAFFAAWTGLSATWAASAESAYSEFARAVFYLGVFVAGAVFSRPRSLGAWRDGLATGIVAVGLLSLVSRLVPGSVSGAATVGLSFGSQRLSYPLGYWNGLGILLALAVPLLVSASVDAGRRMVRVAAIGVVPAIGATIFLTSSRGAVAVTGLGVLVLICATPRRWPVVVATALAAVGVAAAVILVASQHAVTKGSVGGAATTQGRLAAIGLAVIAVGVGSGWLALERLGLSSRTPSVPLVRAGLAIALAALVLVAVLSHPIARFDSFRRPPAAGPSQTADTITSHLLSSSGSGRWQFWSAAVDEFRSSPLHGRGAGSFEAWWAAHGTLRTFVRNAHSLYLEVLGELGLVGAFLLLAFVVASLVVGVARVRRARDPGGAALLAAAAAFLLAAGIDWMWQLTAVGAIGVLCLGLISGSGLGSPATSRRPARAARLGLCALAGAAIVVLAPALLSRLQLDGSQAAAATGRLDQAADDARRAHVLEPWAASPFLQLALVEEQGGDLRHAESSVRSAIARDASDWRSWLVAARIQTEAGEVARARRSLAEARRLDPRSLLVGTSPR